MIKTVKDLIDMTARIPDDDQSLFAYCLRDKVKNDPRAALRWYKKIEAQEQRRGQMLDFTKRKIGVRIKWYSEFPISVCPVCGRNGIVYTDPQYVFFTEHVIYIHGGMITAPLDECKWGEKWVSEYDSKEYNEALVNGGVRMISDPTPSFGDQHIVYYTKKQNYGLVNHERTN